MRRKIVIGQLQQVPRIHRTHLVVVQVGEVRSAANAGSAGRGAGEEERYRRYSHRQAARDRAWPRAGTHTD